MQYTAELTRKLAPYDVKWIEEPLMPDEYSAHARLSEKMRGMGVTTYLATGEHEYSRWGFNALIDAAGAALRHLERFVRFRGVHSGQ